MKLICVVFLLLFFPAISLNSRQSYAGLERKLRDVFSERTGVLHLLTRSTQELNAIKSLLQVLRVGEVVTKHNVQRILEVSQMHRKDMMTLHVALQKQMDESIEKEEKQKAKINFLKMEMERKNKVIKDLQQENKSLKNKLLSGNKLCGIHAEESKKIQEQLKELRNRKKHLIFKGEQWTDLERKLAVAKEDLEKAALDKDSQLKALKTTVDICFSSVLSNFNVYRLPAAFSDVLKHSSITNHSSVTVQPHNKDIDNIQRIVSSQVFMDLQSTKTQNTGLKECQNEMKSQELQKVENGIEKYQEDIMNTEGTNKSI